jgi:dihydroorotase
VLFDVIIRGGRLIDPSENVDGVRDVAFRNGRVAQIAEHIAEPAIETFDAAGCIVSPGLIDMHTHVYWGGTSMGVEVEPLMRSGGTTTLIDAGSAGPANFAGFRRHIIEPSGVRILAYLNISFPGIFAYSRAVMVGECSDLRLLDPSECVRVINENRDLLVGVKARVGRIAGGTNGLMPLDLAIEAAAETGMPVMAHIDNPPPTRREVLERLRPGDILTHCFKPFPNAPIRSDGEIWEEVVVARERGIIFDIGHGTFSFGFRVARGMLDKGFVPDVISSDVHALNINGPTYNLLTTLSKFYAMGLSLPEIVRTATANPAQALHRPELGTLRIGAVADATIFDIEDGTFKFYDALGEALDSRQRLRLRATVVDGALSRSSIG